MADSRSDPENKSWTVSQITELIGGRTNSPPHVEITGIAGIKEADEGDITFVMHKRYLPLIKQTKASAIIVSRRLDIDESETSAALIRVDDPETSFATIAQQFSGGKTTFEPGIHPAALIGKGVSFGKDVVVQAFAVISNGAAMGRNTVIYPNVYIGHNSKIGDECLIYPGVSIRERTIIGNRVIIHSGTVIGSDGFGFATADGVHHKIPHMGTVEIEDDVEIGANVTVDRARFGKTHIGKGTKIDNLVQIAHNVWVGERCLLVGQSGVAGSTRIGNNTVVAAQAGVVGHLDIGDNVIIAGQAGVTKNIPANTRVSGYPAQDHDKQRREQIHVRKLPQYCARIKDLEERLSQLEKAAENDSS